MFVHWAQVLSLASSQELCGGLHPFKLFVLLGGSQRFTRRQSPITPKLCLRRPRRWMPLVLREIPPLMLCDHRSHDLPWSRLLRHLLRIVVAAAFSGQSRALLLLTLIFISGFQSVLSCFVCSSRLKFLENWTYIVTSMLLAGCDLFHLWQILLFGDASYSSAPILGILLGLWW